MAEEAQPSARAKEALRSTSEETAALAEIRTLPRDWLKTTEDRWAEIVERWDPDSEKLAELAAIGLLTGPVLRDAHLALLDKVLLPKLKDRRLSFKEFFASARSQHVIDVLTVESPFLVPVLWRWLLDAHRRRLIEPADGGVPRADSLWDLSDAGERKVLQYATRAKILAVRARGFAGPLRAAVALVVSLFGAVALLKYATAFAPIAIPLVGLALFALAMDFYDHRALRKAQLRERAEGRRVQDPWDALIEYALFFEATLQELASRNWPGATLSLEAPS